MWKDGEKIGYVSSGGFSPLLKVGIGMGYIHPEFKDGGTSLKYEVRGKLYDAVVRKFPLYDSSIFGRNRKE